MTFETLTNGINELFENNHVLKLEFDINYIMQSQDLTFDEFSEKIDTWINEVEVIYYSTAIQYLAQNDNSLNESMNIAAEYGYEVQNINSELLATLLTQKNLRDAWSEISDEVEELFDQYEDENEEE